MSSVLDQQQEPLTDWPLSHPRRNQFLKKYKLNGKLQVVAKNCKKPDAVNAFEKLYEESAFRDPSESLAGAEAKDKQLKEEKEQLAKVEQARKVKPRMRH
jgi:hypothetical protein